MSVPSFDADPGQPSFRYILSTHYYEFDERFLPSLSIRFTILFYLYKQTLKEQLPTTMFIPPSRMGIRKIKNEEKLKYYTDGEQSSRNVPLNLKLKYFTYDVTLSLQKVWTLQKYRNLYKGKSKNITSNEYTKIQFLLGSPRIVDGIRAKNYSERWLRTFVENFGYFYREWNESEERILSIGEINEWKRRRRICTARRRNDSSSRRASERSLHRFATM